MLHFDHAPERATNLTLNAKLLDLACELGMNVSQTVDALLTEEVKRRDWERWNAENGGAIAHQFARVEREGQSLDRHRSFLENR